MSVDWSLFLIIEFTHSPTRAESVRIELTWVLPQPQLSKPVHYLSVYSPNIFMFQPTVTPISIVASHISSSWSIFINPPRSFYFDSVFNWPLRRRGWTLFSIMRRERDSNSWSFYTQAVFKTASSTNRTLSIVWVIPPKAGQTVTTLQLRRTHISGWRKIRTFNHRLNKPPLCRWAIHPCWPGETRTLNSRCKRPVLLSNWVTNQCCDDWQIRTINLYGISVVLLTIELNHQYVWTGINEINGNPRIISLISNIPFIPVQTVGLTRFELVSLHS